MADESQDNGPNLDELRKIVADLKGAGGSDALGKKLADVLEDNARLRARLRGEKAAAVPDGGLALSADDAKRWKKYLGLGDDPGEVAKQLAAGQRAAVELGDIRTAETHRKAAEAVGFRPGLLARMAKADGLRLVVEEKTGEDGKPVRNAFVMGEGDARTPLGKYAEAHWGDDLPALKADPDKATAATALAGPGYPPGERRSTPPPVAFQLKDDEAIRVALQRRGIGSL